MTAETWTTDDLKAWQRGEHVPIKAAKRPCPPSITLELPHPGNTCSPNSRAHWTARHKSIKAIREAAATIAAYELRKINATPPRWERAEVEATFYRPGNRAKLVDEDNAIATLKGIFDGLQDAGIIANDSGLSHLPPKQLLGAAAGGERKVVLRISQRSNP